MAGPRKGTQKRKPDGERKPARGRKSQWIPTEDQEKKKAAWKGVHDVVGQRA